MNTEKIIAVTIWTFVGKVTSLLFNMLSRLSRDYNTAVSTCFVDVFYLIHNIYVCLKDNFFKVINTMTVLGAPLPCPSHPPASRPLGPYLCLINARWIPWS